MSDLRFHATVEILRKCVCFQCPCTSLSLACPLNVSILCRAATGHNETSRSSKSFVQKETHCCVRVSCAYSWPSLPSEGALLALRLGWYTRGCLPSLRTQYMTKSKWRHLSQRYVRSMSRLASISISVARSTGSSTSR